MNQTSNHHNTAIICLGLFLVLATVQPTQAATSGTQPLDLTVSNVQGFVVKMEQAETSGTANDGKIIADPAAPVAVTYTIWTFDRNGEADLAADHDLTISVYGPNPDGTSQQTTLLSSASVTVSFCAGLAGAGASEKVGDPGDDSVNVNGVRKCVVTVTYNAGGAAAAPGSYSIRARLSGTAVDQTIVSHVYDLLDILLQLVNSGGVVQTGTPKVSFATSVPTDTVRVAANRLQVSNQKTASFDTTLSFTDLTCSACSGTVATVANSAIRLKEGAVFTATYADPGNAGSGDLSLVAGSKNTGTKIDEGEKISYSFALNNLVTQGQQNSILQDGAYAGTLTVVANADTGGASPYVYNGSTYSPASPAGSTSYLNLNPDGLGAITLGS